MEPVVVSASVWRRIQHGEDALGSAFWSEPVVALHMHDALRALHDGAEQLPRVGVSNVAQYESDTLLVEQVPENLVVAMRRPDRDWHPELQCRVGRSNATLRDRKRALGENHRERERVVRHVGGANCARASG